MIAWGDARTPGEVHIFAQHVLGSGAIDPSTSASGRAFVAKWKKAYGTPDIFAVEYYNAAKATLLAIGAGKTSRKDINSYLAKVKFQGPTGPVAFDSRGDLKAAKINFYKIKNGNFVFIGAATK